MKSIYLTHPDVIEKNRESEENDAEQIWEVMEYGSSMVDEVIDRIKENEYYLEKGYDTRFDVY